MFPLSNLKLKLSCCTIKTNLQVMFHLSGDQVKFIVTAAVLLLLSIQLALALSNINLLAEQRSAETRAAEIITPDIQLPAGKTAFNNQRWNYENYDYWQLGTTCYEFQHVSTQGKQIVIGDDGIVHFAWMKAPLHDPGERHVVYVCFDWGPFGGNPVDNTGRSGYCTIDVLDGEATYANAAVISFHQQPQDYLVSAVAPDYGPCWQAFLPFNHPPVGEWGATDQPIWPHMAIDYNNKAHVMATRPMSNDHYYDATSDFTTWDIPGWRELPSYNGANSAVPVTSEFDSRVAILTHDHLPVHPYDDRPMIFSQGLNDVWVYLSEDGDFSDSSYVNVTDLYDEETTNHPLPGCVYAYCDLDAIFDADGNLHVVYTTFPYWREQTMLDGELYQGTDFWRWSRDGQIWHALIDTEGEVLEFSHIAGYVGSNSGDPEEWAHYFESSPGGWGSTIDRPSLAINPDSGNLYCMFRSFSNQADTSAAGYSNADLYIASSCDNGSSWGQAVNTTDSQTPGCEAGDCASEAWGTLAEVVFEGSLHMEFVCDLDAGAFQQDEGSWVDSPVYYMQVPVDSLSCGEAWDLPPRASRLTDHFWDWGELEDGTYEIEDYMRMLNESRSPVEIISIEVLYNGTPPDVELIGVLAADIAPYDYHEYSYLWNATIDDDQHDAALRFHTNGGSCDFTLANRNDLDLETAESFLLWGEDVPNVGARSPRPPQTIQLSQNYPNPFNPTTTIEFTLPQAQRVELAVYNILGEQVAVLADGMFQAGLHRVAFDNNLQYVGARFSRPLPSGVYVYRLIAGGQVNNRKMILIN